jgi:hypothetical protein
MGRPGPWRQPSPAHRGTIRAYPAARPILSGRIRTGPIGCGRCPRPLQRCDPSEPTCLARSIGLPNLGDHVSGRTRVNKACVLPRGSRARMASTPMEVAPDLLPRRLPPALLPHRPTLAPTTSMSLF